MSTPTKHLPPTYKALSGPELYDLISKRLDALKDRLKQTGKFDPNVTYPNCQFVVTVQVHLPIMRDRDFTVTEIVDEQPLAPDTPAEDLILTETVAESPENPPDRIREQAGLPVTVTEIGNGHAGLPTVREVPVVRESRKGERR